MKESRRSKVPTRIQSYIFPIKSTYVSLATPAVGAPGSPDAVEDSSVGEDPYVHVGHGDFVQLPSLLVFEEQVGHPDFLRVGQCQEFHTTCESASVSNRHSLLYKIIKLLKNALLYLGTKVILNKLT